MIVWINGPTGAGKTSLALRLQERAAGVYLHAELDKFISMLPTRIQRSRQSLLECVDAIVGPFHKTALMLADAGSDLIVDHVFEKAEWFDECCTLFADKHVYLVGLTAEPHVLAKRALNRGDREPNLYLEHATTVHKHTAYDVYLDSTSKTVDELASELFHFMEGTPPRLGLRRQLQD
jgi:chloramphenicol 3-O phosphotransferase